MENQWNIYIHDPEILIDIPDKLGKLARVIKVNEEDPAMLTWARMETDIYSRLVNHWPNSHTGIRLYTYYMPLQLTSQNQCHVEEIETKERDTYTYIIGDCNVRKVWELFFEVGTNWDGGRLIFTLESQQQDWISTTEKIHGIVQKIAKLEPIEKFMDELYDFRLVCYSIDAGLMIAKADITQASILKILEDVAIENGFELNIEKAES